jgi:hypothetical protein
MAARMRIPASSNGAERSPSRSYVPVRTERPSESYPRVGFPFLG